jgi:anaerobic selenocysteine-containing dehydrogenase
MTNFNPTRRNFLKASAAAGSAVVTGKLLSEAEAAPAVDYITNKMAPTDHCWIRRPPAFLPASD